MDQDTKTRHEEGAARRRELYAFSADASEAEIISVTRQRLHRLLKSTVARPKHVQRGVFGEMMAVLMEADLALRALADTNTESMDTAEASFIEEKGTS